MDMNGQEICGGYGSGFLTTEYTEYTERGEEENFQLRTSNVQGFMASARGF